MEHIGNIKNNDYKLDLSPGSAVDIRLGLGIDMSDPLNSHNRTVTFSVPTQTPDMPTPDDLVTSNYYISESTSYQEEARKLAASFRAKYGFVSGRAAMSRAKRDIDQKKILWIEIGTQGKGISIPRESIKWSSPPVSESISDLAERRRQFLSDHGSHYVNRIYFGQKIIIRATYNSKIIEERRSFSAAIKAFGGTWGGGASLASSQKNILRSSKTEIDVAIVSGPIDPPGAYYLGGYDDTKEFLSKVKNKDYKVKSGPIQCDLISFWHTLYDYKNTRNIFSIPSAKPVPTEFGVPSGTVLPWIPPSESIVWDEDLNLPVKIIPPEGWIFCDGENGTPKLDGKFPLGTLDPAELRLTAGEEKHDHRVKGATTLVWDPNNTIKDGIMNIEGAKNWNHKHRFDELTDESSNMPPYAMVAYIMKE